MSLRDRARDAAARAARHRLTSRAVRATARASAAVDRWAPPTLTILTYHRIAPPVDDPVLAPTMRNASPEEFDAHLAVVAQVSTPVSLAQVRAAVEHGSALPPRAVLVTFDDAYRDFAEHAWPVLRRRSIPAAMFVATAYPGDDTPGFWWDRVWAALRAGARPDPSLVPDGTSHEPMAIFRVLRAHLKSLPHHEAMRMVDELVDRADGSTPRGSVLGWDQLRSLRDQGLAIGAHSHRHPLLTRLPPVEAEAEIRRSVEILQSRGFEDATVLAYPGGGHDDQVRAAARAAGCTLAMTTDRGTNRLDRLEPFRLRRVNVGQRTSPAALAAQLVPTLGHLRRWAP